MTPKQEAFCLAYIETGNASEAYRVAYNAENMKPESIWVKACELLASGKVTARVAELKAAALKRHEMTVDDIAKLLLEDRTFARECETPGAAVTASLGLAKLFGLLRDRVEHTGKDGGAIEIEQRIRDDADAVTSAIAGLVERQRTGTVVSTTEH